MKFIEPEFKNKNLTQKDKAEEIGISDSKIKRENNDMHMDSLDNAKSTKSKQISQALSLTSSNIKVGALPHILFAEAGSVTTKNESDSINGNYLDKFKIRKQNYISIKWT